MKPRLLDLIVCPECSSKFTLRGEKSERISYSDEWDGKLKDYWESRVSG